MDSGIGQTFTASPAQPGGSPVRTRHPRTICGGERDWGQVPLTDSVTTRIVGTHIILSRSTRQPIRIRR